MRNAISYRRFGASVCAIIFSLVAILALAQTGPAQGARLPLGARNRFVSADSASATPPVLVIGFVGGFIRHDDLVHSEVQLAARIRKAYPSGVDVETFESYHGENAVKKILSLLDANHNGTLTQSEKQNARIILYGHSWGASEAIAVARVLDRDGIPVLLTIQVYQPDGFVHGQSAIRAADPARTKIIGNFRFDYKTSSYNCYEYPWYDRFFVKAHTQIECDPNVWKQAEALIRADLPPAAGAGQ